MTTMTPVPEEVRRAGPRVVKFYRRMVREGTSEKLAEMLALQSPPRSNTDREFFEGHANGNQFDGAEDQGNFLRQQAIRRGFTPGKNDVYLSQLAKFPGDPAAWVPPGGGRSHVEKVLKKRGWGAQGSVNVRAREVEVNHDPVTPLADDLVKKNAKKALAANPDMTAKQRRELREKIIHDHGFRKH